MKFQKVKGTRDFYPDQMAIRNWLVGKWREIALRNGFVEYDGPTFEYLDLYKAKSGDAIVSELYHFQDRGGRELALRPEMTPTLARMVAARAASLPRPLKWFSVPNFFRAERPQRGRLREFFQWNIDIIGTEPDAEALADAECIFVALHFLKAAGFEPQHIEMKISSRQLLAQVLEHLGLAPARHAAVFTILDKRDKVPAEVFEAELHKLGLDARQARQLIDLCDAKGHRGLGAIDDLLGGAQRPDSPLGRMHRVMNLLSQMGMGAFCDFDLGVVRGLVYYTGTVFEAYGGGTLKRAICGGGRYDDLLGALGGPPLSAVGFGMGDCVLLDQLDELGRLQVEPAKLKWYIVSDGPEHVDTTMVLVSLIRQARGESCDFSYKRSLKKQMQQAAERQAEYVLLVGDRIRLKEMASGEQHDLSAAPDQLQELQTLVEQLGRWVQPPDRDGTS